MSQPKYIGLDGRESLLQSIVKDAVTFSLILLCIYTSKGSNWWTFFTTLLLIAYAGSRMTYIAATRQTKLHTKADAVKWANELPEDA